MKVKVHPAADLFPLMEGAAFEELKASIRDHGQRVPCMAWERLGQEAILIDGRNRLRACEELRIQPIFDGFDGTETDVLDAIVALNIRRRSLTKSQAATIAAEFVPLYEEAAKAAKAATWPVNFSKRWEEHPVPPKVEEPEQVVDKCVREAVGQAAASMGVSKSYVAEARALQKQDPQAFKEVRLGKESLSKARARSRPPKEEPTLFECARAAVFKLSDAEWQQLKKERDESNENNTNTDHVTTHYRARI